MVGVLVIVAVGMAVASINNVGVGEIVNVGLGVDVFTRGVLISLSVGSGIELFATTSVEKGMRVGSDCEGRQDAITSIRIIRQIFIFIT